MSTIKVSRADRTIKAILAACYPDYKGRKVTVKVTASYGGLTNYWDGGSRNYVIAYDLATGKVAQPLAHASNPFRPQAHADLAVPEGVLIVEHSIFCGRDAGVTIYVNPANMAKLLPSATAPQMGA